MGTADDTLVYTFLATGEPSAFDEIVRRHHAAIRSMLRRLCRDESLADDLAQETFVKALTRLDRYDGGDRLRSWLGGIAYRELLMMLRRNRRVQRREEQAALLQSDVSSADASFAERLDLDRALDLLPRAERVAIVLNQACGMSHAEIARATGTPLGTVKTHIERARRMLHKTLSEGETR